MADKTIILFGGTFDPVHLAHTIVANESAQYLCAEKIVFIPAKHSPLKDSLPKASDEQRLEMIALAIEENDKFLINDYELSKSAPSYTFDTVRHFHKQYGQQTIIHWLIGSDAMKDLPHWYKIKELIDCCNLSVMYRAGFGAPDFSKFEGIWGKDRIEKLRKNTIKTSLVDISSTKIRAALAAGENADKMLCPAVADYIDRHRLYR